MNQKFSLALTGISLAAGLFFANCKKEQTAGLAGPSSLATSGYSFPTRGGDRIDAIVQGLATDQYSLSFDKPIPSAGITKTAYGADNYLVYADPQDVICPEPLRYKFRRFPIWKLPNFVQPTCPDMIIDISKFKQIQDLIVKADPAQFGKLKEVTLSNGGGFFAGQEFLSQNAKMQVDKIDDLTGDLDGAKFMMFNGPDDKSGLFTRNAYGYADLYQYIFKPYRLTLKDILRPTLKGCFDPIVLETIRQRLEKVSPEVFKGLNVTPIDEAGNAAVLSF